MAKRTLTEHEIDTIVEYWHDGTIDADCLQDALGWTWEEYAHWATTNKIPEADKTEKIPIIYRQAGDLSTTPKLWVVRLECGCVAIVDIQPTNCDSVYCNYPNHSDAHAINWRTIDPED